MQSNTTRETKKGGKISPAAEVEARNASARRFMSMDERRNTLLSETEDVAEDDKIYLEKLIDGDMSMTETTGNAVNFLYLDNKVIPIAEGFDFNKTLDMQQSMKDYILLLDGKSFVINEDNTTVYFNEESATEYSNSNYTKSLKNRHAKLFKSKAKAVSALGSIIENAHNGRNEPVKKGHSKYGQKGTYRRYDIKFGHYSGMEYIKIYTGELLIWNPKNGNSVFYDISNIKFDRKVWKTANAETPTGPRQDSGDTLHRPSINGGNISQNAENANNIRYSVRPQEAEIQAWELKTSTLQLRAFSMPQLLK